MKTQEIQLSNGERFEIIDSSAPMTHELIRSVIDAFETPRYMQALAYTNLATVSCVATVAGILSGSITVTSCPINNVPGTAATTKATATNTGNVGNSSFVILCSIARADTGSTITSGNSGNLTLAPGATSAEYSLLFTMPGVNVNIAYILQADPAFNY